MADLAQGQTNLRRRQDEVAARNRKTILLLAGGLLVAAIPLAGLFYQRIKDAAVAADAGIKPAFQGRNGARGLRLESPERQQANAPLTQDGFLSYVKAFWQTHPTAPPAKAPPAAPALPPPAPALKAPAASPAPVQKSFFLYDVPKLRANTAPMFRKPASPYQVPGFQGNPSWASGQPLGGGNAVPEQSGQGGSGGSAGGNSLPVQPSVLSGP